MTSEIRIPHRTDPLSPEEANKALIEAIELVHILVGGGWKPPLPDWLVARAHRFFSIQAVDPKERDKGCSCSACRAHPA